MSKHILSWLEQGRLQFPFGQFVCSKVLVYAVLIQMVHQGEFGFVILAGISRN